MNVFNVSHETTGLKTGGLNGEILAKNVLLLLFGFLAFGGNALIITVIGKFKNLCNDEPYVQMMGVLAVADGVNGLGASIAAIERLRVQLTNPSTTKLECIGTSTVLIIGMISSQVALACIGVDRFCSLKKPLEYRARNHMKYAYLCLFISFFIAFCLSSVMFLGVDYWTTPPLCNLAASATFTFQTLWTVFSFSVATFVFIVYILILKLLRQRISSDLTRNRTNGPVRNDARFHIEEIKATKTVIVVLSVYMLFWVFPNIVLNISKLLGISAKLRGRIGPFVALGSAFSSSINILVYTLKLKGFRKYLKKFLKTPALIPPAPAAQNTVFPAKSNAPGHSSERSKQYITKKDVTRF